MAGIVQEGAWPPVDSFFGGWCQVVSVFGGALGNGLLTVGATVKLVLGAIGVEIPG